MQYSSITILLFLNVAMIYFMVLVNCLHINNKKCIEQFSLKLLMACFCNLFCLCFLNNNYWTKLK